MKSVPTAASGGIPRHFEGSEEAPPAPEFPRIPRDAAGCSARQREQERAATALADDLLTAVGAGEDQAAELAVALANAVLDESGVKLANAVLEGGPLTITRAIRLAEVVLTSRAPSSEVAAS
ncbi:MAG TPA: hypothetical protein VGM06_22065 [Polyangiaceae bacterium]